MKTVYLIRHGESEINVGSTFMHDDPPPLTPKGVHQAHAVAERCTRLPIDTIIASTMVRAQETAGIIGKRIGRRVEFSEEFVQRRQPSSLVGRGKNDEAGKAALEALEETYRTDTPEFRAIRERARRAFSLLEKRTERNILVVTHGFFMRTLFAYVLFGSKLTPNELGKVTLAIPSTANTHISVFRFDEADSEAPWRIWVWNDHAHLG